mgnify:CR=1 FL=1
MGRAALDWSIQRLADECVVSARTIKRIEAQSGEPIATPANIKLIVETLENEEEILKKSTRTSREGG